VFEGQGYIFDCHILSHNKALNDIDI
jgi:hypothetical protein